MSRPTTLLAAASAVLLGLGLGVAHPGPASAATVCSSGVPGDVNGDGYAEVAVSSREPQAVHVFYGSRTGLQTNAKGSALDDQVFTQDSKGIPGSPGQREKFGHSTTFGDFDGDGCADLAIGAPRDYSRSGTMTILYGSPKGLTTTRVTQIVGVDSVPADWYFAAEFGTQLSHGDVTNDGIDDLLVEVPNAIDTGSDVGDTALVVYTGGAGGLSTAANRRIPLTAEDLGSQFSTGINGYAVGDFDGNGSRELAVSSGGIAVVTFGADRIASYRRDVVNEPARQLIAGDTNGDGRDDLALTDSPYDYEAGVVLLFGSARGLGTAGSREWSPRELRLSADYGPLKLDMGRLDSGSTADLVVTGEGTKVGKEKAAGALTVLFGGSNGPSLDRTQHLSEATAGVPGSAKAFDYFGASVTTSVVQGGTQASLIVGAPNESTKKKSSGRFYFFPRGTAGPAAKSSRAISLDTAGVKGTSAKNGTLGLTVGGPDSWSLNDD